MSRGLRQGTAWLAFCALGAMPFASGCGAFFKCEGKSSCPATGTGTDSGDVVFAGNQSSTGIYAYYLSGSQMYGVAGEPFTTSFAAQSMVVSRANGYLFASAGAGIYSFAVSSTGVLSGEAEPAITSYTQSSMDVSPDGNWLVAVDNGVSSSPQVKVYKISSGTLTINTSVTTLSLLTSGGSLSPKMVRFSPNNDYIAVAMTTGTLVIPFTDSDGTQSKTGVSYYISDGTLSGDNAIAWDGNENLYIGRATSVTTGSGATTGVWYVPVASLKSGSALNTNVSPTRLANTTTAPQSLVFTPSYTRLYTADPNDSKISGFTVANTSGAVTLTSLGATTAGPTGVQSLAVDSTGDYLFAGGTSASSGLILFSIATDGSLTQENSEATGTTTGVPVLAVTH